MRFMLVAVLLASSLASAKPLPRQLMTVELKNAQLSHFFRLVAEKADANLVIDDCAGKQVADIRLRNVRLDEIVAVIAREHHLEVDYDGATISVRCE
jgi:hypothetical protein